MYKIYIASPYTLGGQAQNVRRQIDAANILMDFGYAPYTPLLFHFQELIHPRPEHEMLSLELEYLKICDAVFRIIPRDINNDVIISRGADLEERTANDLLIPVFKFFSVDEIRDFLSSKSKKRTIDEEIINAMETKKLIEV